MPTTSPFENNLDLNISARTPGPCVYCGFEHDQAGRRLDERGKLVPNAPICKGKPQIRLAGEPVQIKTREQLQTEFEKQKI
jgi:hypothetical protein